MSNSLINEKSPYLLQHAENPVDWMPWGEAAFARAEREDKPVFLSIGYSTCHWCHVMAHESFEDPQVAELLNRDFVSVKVDREERPDVDAVYMEVCTALNGSGGWPLTVLMTPQKQPFFAATYLPKDNRGGRLGLLGLLTMIAAKWRRDREELLAAGEEICAWVSRRRPLGEAEPDQAFLQKAVEQFKASFDEEYGGFGAAPKFPSAHNLLFLLRYAALSGDKAARRMAERTLQQMFRGGIYDHFGGGFSRYSTDREWLLPHFEKTLYDNALLALAYTEAWQEGHLALYRQTAEAVLDYCMRELQSPEGGFYSGQDADSGGEEGGYYGFRPQEIRQLLGEDPGRHFAECYDITEEGNMGRSGKSVPNLLLNQRWNLLPEGYEDFRERLRLYREQRAALPTDTKILTAWNGLLLMALARAAWVFDDPRYLAQARRLAGFLRAYAFAGEEPGSLQACVYGTESRFGARLEDFAFYALGLLELYQADFHTEDLVLAAALAEEIPLRFSAAGGGYYMTARGAEELLKRPMEKYDGAMPSSNSACAVLFDRLSRLTGAKKWREAAEEQLRFICRSGESYPAGHAFGLIALLSAVYPTRELVCVAEKPPAALKSVLARYAPELSVLLKRPGDEALEALAPFTREMRMQGGKPTFYLCSGGSCGLPFTVE